MRAFVFLCVCVWFACAQEERMGRMPKYDERYDYLDVDALFNSKRLVRNYVDCLISAQRCTPEGKQLKRVLPEALRTKCARCTERQKKTAVKVIKRLKHEFPEEWAKLASRWDPTGDFTRYFEEFLSREHFNTVPGSAGNNEVPEPSAVPIPVVPQRLPAVPASSPPPPPPAPSAPPPATPVVTSPKPAILNRFGEDGELMQGSPSGAVTPRPGTPRPIVPLNTYRPPQPAGAPTQSPRIPSEAPTRFPLRPGTTAITFIDQIGYKIIRTTELVTDLLKNTVRAVVGR